MLQPRRCRMWSQLLTVPATCLRYVVYQREQPSSESERGDLAEAAPFEISPSAAKSQARLGSIPLQASTSPVTAATDLSSIAFSSLFRLISITFSMPFAPITTGTPK